MKWIRKCPLFLLILSTGILFTIISLSGKKSIYAGQEYAPLKAPLLSVMFTAINDGIYPWQVLESGSIPASVPGFQGTSEAPPEEEMPVLAGQPSSAPQEDVSGEDGASGNDVLGDDISGNDLPESDISAKEDAQILEAADQISAGTAQLMEDVRQLPGQVRRTSGERIEPLRESTYEEYINHISADIYGDIGVIRAAEYDFLQVDESYFDDALFIGDSRTVGLRDYTDLPEHADFYCETSLTIYKVLEEKFKGLGTIQEALAAKDYGKIYIMVGINELGTGTTENYMEKYTEVIDTLREWEPGAKIIIQGVMRVSGQKNSSDAIFNNSNIIARNNAVATLADNDTIFYIDVNEVVCDEEGNLREDYTFDQIHLLGVYNDVYKQFLLSHGVS